MYKCLVEDALVKALQVSVCGDYIADDEALEGVIEV